MTDAFLFDRAAILAGVARLDVVLGDRGVPHQSLVVVGGSYLALTDLREATHDIDTISSLDAAFRQASDAVADEMGLPHGWANDNAAPFAPIGLTEEHCSVAFALAIPPVVVPALTPRRVVGTTMARQPTSIRSWTAWAAEPQLDHSGNGKLLATCEHFETYYYF